ncbi:MAG: hypothetical protein KGH79_02305 [Patescibacteria group bacterium]|nr:hypothetical protein [Patescibacteria group bacterium]
MDQDSKDPKNLPAGSSDPASPSQGGSGAGHIDLGKILLPKKETPGQTPQSAQRVNAGTLLEQEQTAGKEGSPKPPEELASVGGADSGGYAPVLEGEQKESAPPAPKKDESAVKPIETYQGDIEQLVQDKNVSVLTIAAAEAERRARTESTAAAQGPAVKETFSERLERIKQASKKASMYIAGAALLLAAAGGLAYVFLRPTATAPTQAPSSPFIAVDDTKVITIDPSNSRDNIMSQLTSAQSSVNLSLGLIDRLLPATASTTPSGQTLVAMDAQSFLSALAPNIPPALLRTISPTFLLGVHVYVGNQALLILNVDSYEDAYAGMLAWEPTMLSNLSPLFVYKPSPHIPEENISTSTVATTTDEFLQTGFVDRIIENHDARVLQNSTGDIYLLWTFLDRNTLVITTNDATLREIISRLQQAPVTPIPGQ